MSHRAVKNQLSAKLVSWCVTFVFINLTVGNIEISSIYIYIDTTFCLGMTLSQFVNIILTVVYITVMEVF